MAHPGTSNIEQSAEQAMDKNVVFSLNNSSGRNVLFVNEASHMYIFIYISMLIARLGVKH